MESDPIGLRGGLNTYTYVRSGPVSGSDVLGLLDYFGVGAIQEHLEILARRQGDDLHRSGHLAAERAMLDRIKAGKDTLYDIAWYHHEKAEADLCRQYQNRSDFLVRQQQIHDHLESVQGNTMWQRYHPDVIRAHPELFPPRR